MSDLPRVHAIILADDVLVKDDGLDLIGVKNTFRLKKIPANMKLVVFVLISGIRNAGRFQAKILHSASGFEVAASKPGEIPYSGDPVRLIQYTERFSEFLIKDEGEYELHAFWSDEILETRKFIIRP